MNGTIALLAAIISSPDVSAPDVWYKGKCSWFRADHTSALMHPLDWFVPGAYCACRWKYDTLSRKLGVPRNEVKSELARCQVQVRNPSNGKVVTVKPIDWGPRRTTGRAIDLDKGSLDALGAKTDDVLQFVLLRGRDYGKGKEGVSTH